ncbi:EutN/CcmL family microcompartment protein [Roseovarius nubinhibens]|uniref:Ethanolamine utilization protein EutN n=1 Tax=Roseovarius nubinhibens TaxID=314263 RepID=A0A348WCA0_9RHOB|nr:EutN/CcmL family microcompartment protein [Roseovarius nubinhibens]MBU3000336.1 EutN/CcmL family microcompartment protein [Roseovarius nubinhibens]HAR52162.1 ethanolamine utilization protein EutN [Roseovarius nubinhibens]|tara:strand:+ start:9489 stop:9734 length:246 start_codon:yes stop_codon:yes gene_type:complete
MIKGRVNGKIWSSRHVDTLPGGALLEVEIDGGGRLIAFDPLGCDAGEAVLVTQGSVAAAFFKGRTAPIDALIIGSIDEKTK